MIILDRLPVFIAVAEELNFSRAAEKLGRTQSAVSQSIALLEDELGVRLFLREGRRIRLSEPGHLLLTQSRYSLEHIETAYQQIQEWKGLERGSLHIGSSHTTAYYLLPPVLEIFHRRYPDMEVVITEILSDETPPALLNGKIDLGVGILPNQKTPLSLFPLLDRRDVLISGTPVSLDPTDPTLEKTLKNHPFILPSKGMQSRKYLDRILASWEEQPRIVMESDNVEVIKKMVSAGLGVTILPELAVAEEVLTGSLYAYPVPPQEALKQVGLMLAPESVELPGVKAFKGLICDYYSKSESR